MVNRKKYWEKRNKGVTEYRHRLKAHKKCSMCGSTKNLIWHHENPSDKDRKIAHITNKKQILNERRKTVLLCPKCHSKVHKS